MIGSKGLIHLGVKSPPGFCYHCPICGGEMHFVASEHWWHCFHCGTDWPYDDLMEVLEHDEY